MNQSDASKNESGNLPVELPQDITSITILVERARDGCAESKDKVFDQLQSFLHSTASRHASNNLSHKQGVSDIVQQSFVKAIEKFESFRGQSGPELRGWLKQLVINEIRQINRGWKRQRRDVSREKPLETQPTNTGNLDGEWESPEQRLIRAEKLARVRDAIETLPPDYRTIIQLRNFEQRSLDEISAIMDRSKEATTKLWYRAILKLKQSVGDDEREA